MCPPFLFVLSRHPLSSPPLPSFRVHYLTRSRIRMPVHIHIWLPIIVCVAGDCVCECVRKCVCAHACVRVGVHSVHSVSRMPLRTHTFAGAMDRQKVLEYIEKSSSLAHSSSAPLRLEVFAKFIRECDEGTGVEGEPEQAYSEEKMELLWKEAKDSKGLCTPPLLTAAVLSRRVRQVEDARGLSSI
mmetsp:Transcript_4207/g.8300  ORF Transcript_4207/g.8300 Transcript_4207/m.8300 type:complete len:186 (-) Transcript_4207:62-619(-)